MPSRRQDRLVVDTNLWISFLISDSYHKLDQHLPQNELKFLFSNELLSELLEVIRRPKFKRAFSPAIVNYLLDSIHCYSELIEVNTKVDRCRDAKDNFLLALCEDGQADCLLTGDIDLLSLEKHKKTKIIKISDYLLLF
jgi:putative PIN family toxin of toxin-antitoxin system